MRQATPAQSADDTSGRLVLPARRYVALVHLEAHNQELAVGEAAGEHGDSQCADFDDAAAAAVSGSAVVSDVTALGAGHGEAVVAAPSDP